MNKKTLDVLVKIARHEKDCRDVTCHVRAVLTGKDPSDSDIKDHYVEMGL